jgi:hypothetical protein
MKFDVREFYVKLVGFLDRTRLTTCIFERISLNIYRTGKMFQTNIVEKTHTCFVPSTLSPLFLWFSR